MSYSGIRLYPVDRLLITYDVLIATLDGTILPPRKQHTTCRIDIGYPDSSVPGCVICRFGRYKYMGTFN